VRGDRQHQEAEDDEDAIQKIIVQQQQSGGYTTGSCCEWEPEANPFASEERRMTSTAPVDRPYYENAAWHGWRF
jgi:hypothetical protein